MHGLQLNLINCHYRVPKGLGTLLKLHRHRTVYAHIYRSITGSAPSYFHSHLWVYVPTRSLRSINERRLVVPSKSPCWWNDLLTVIQNAESLNIQKKTENSSLL